MWGVVAGESENQISIGSPGGVQQCELPYAGIR